ncbi:hypothetical protein [Bosea sp. AS-1]|nr:hypothetical protein [Bosea sp. AS-1]
MPEWLAVLAMLLTFVQGFVLGGILYARTPFWDGVRSVYSFGRSAHDR